MRKTVILLVSVSFLLLTGCADHYKTSRVQATVVEKDYDAATTKTKTTRKDGKTVRKTVRVPAEYDVTLEYQGIQTEIDSKKLFDRVSEGQQVEVVLNQGYTKDGKLTSQSIKLP